MAIVIVLMTIIGLSVVKTPADFLCLGLSILLLSVVLVAGIFRADRFPFEVVGIV